MNVPDDIIEADYVIVGAGSAGCVLAARLSEDPGTRVLLIEAGGEDRHPLLHAPVGFARTMGDPRFDWCYTQGPEPHLDGRHIHYARGRVLGGCSSINGLAWVRGHRADYDAWAAAGCAGWDWGSVRGYFEGAENYAGGGAGRGRGGPVKIEQNPGLHPVSRRLLEAAAQAGLPVQEDHNVEVPLGMSRLQLNLWRGRRQSAAVAYLAPARRRANLRVLTGAEVDRIEIENGVAAGLAIRSAGRAVRVRASAEVILSAGTIGSPLLLERSGVGAADRLARLGIEVRHDAPEVGENLQDHLVVLMQQRLSGIVTWNEHTRGLRVLWHGLRYLATRGGLLAGTPTQITGFARVGAGGGAADIQFFASPMSYHVGTDAAGNVKVSTDSRPGMSFGFNQCRPYSRGHVHLGAADPAAPPSIVANYLADPRDRDIVLAGLKMCRKILAQRAFDDIRAEELGPGAGAVTDEQLMAYVRAAGGTAYHAVGSCRMGADERAVVDPRLRVRGVGRLRIADASIMPAIVSANTHAPTVMIAEKAAALIRAGD
ncbi:MAG: GMC family oxidoreductase [Gammaproteobacteria bacterium]